MKNLLKLLRIVAIFLISAGLIYLGILGKEKLAEMRKKPPRKINKFVPTVRVQKLSAEDIPIRIEGYGKVRPTREVTLAAEVSGRVLEVLDHFKAGYFVEENEILVKIDPSNYLIQKEQLQADLEKLQAKIDHLAQEEKNLEEQVKILEKNVELARARESRTLKLKGSGAESQQIWEQDQQNYLDRVSRLIELQNKKSLLPIQIKEIKADIKGLNTQLKQTETNYQRTFVKTPFKSRIRSAQVEKGAVVNQGTTLAVLEDCSAVEIPVMVSQEDFYKIGLKAEDLQKLHQQKLEIAVTASFTIGKKEFSWKAQLMRIEPLNETTRTIPVIVKVDSPWENSSLYNSEESSIPILIPGKFCKVEITGRTLSQKIVIPRQALHEGNMVYVAKDSRLKIKKVSILHSFENRIVLQEGLEPGELLILTNISFPIPEMPILTKEDKEN